MLTLCRVSQPSNRHSTDSHQAIGSKDLHSERKKWRFVFAFFMQKVIKQRTRMICWRFRSTLLFQQKNTDRCVINNNYISLIKIFWPPVLWTMAFNLALDQRSPHLRPNILIKSIIVNSNMPVTWMLYIQNQHGTLVWKEGTHELHCVGKHTGWV